MKTTPLPEVPAAAAPLPADIATAGRPILKLDRVRLMSADEWEDFALEWAHSLKSKYALVQNCGGAGVVSAR